MMKLFLLLVAAILVPIALSYGIDPAAVLPKFMNITVEGTDQTQIFRALMCLYLGMIDLLRHRRVHADLAACRGDLGRVLRVLAGASAASSASSSTACRAASSLFYMAVELIGARRASVGRARARLSSLASMREKSQLSAALGDDVGQELILDAGDLVLQEQLLLLQPLELELIGAARFLERVDGAVEVAVLLLELEQIRPELANLLALHGRPCSLLPLGDRRKVSRRTPGRARLVAQSCAASIATSVTPGRRPDTGVDIRQSVSDLSQ